MSASAPTENAESAMGAVQAQAESIKNDRTEKVGTMSIGDVVRQGDIYITRIGELPKTRTKIDRRQLTPGETQGSRHTVEGPATIYEADPDQTIALIEKAMGAKSELAAPLIGPVFETTGVVEIAHPEHGNRILPSEPGCYAVTYQRAFADEVRRTLD